MPPLKKRIGMLTCMLASLFVFGNCPNQDYILRIWEENEPEQLQKLAAQLKPCAHLKDTLGLTYHKLGVYFYTTNDLKKAIEFTENSLKIHQELYTASPIIALGKSYHNLGYFYLKINQLEKSEYLLQNAIEIYKKLNKKRELRSCKELAIVYYKQGKYNRARHLYEYVLNENNRHLAPKTFIKSVLDFSDLLNEQKYHQEAVQQLERVSDFLEEIDDSNQVVYYLNMGHAYFGLKSYPKAISFLKKAHTLSYQEKTYAYAATALNDMGVAYQKMGQFSASLDVLEQGKQLAQEIDNDEMLAQAYDNIGELFFIKKEYSKALEYFEKAVKTLSQTDYFPKLEDLKYSVYKTVIIIYLKDYARAMEQIFLVSKEQENINKALSALTLADQLIDKIRIENLGEVGQLFWRKQALPIYEQAISLCHSSKNTEAVFYFFEKSKSILLLEAIQQSDALTALPDSLQQEALALKKDLLRAQNSWNNASQDNKAESLKKLLKTQTSLDAFNQNIKVNYPNIYELIVQPDVIPLEAFQNFLKEREEQVAIQYFLGEQNHYALILRPEKIEIHQYQDKIGMEQDIKAFLSFFEKSSMIEQKPQEYLTIAKKLYDDLFGVLNVEEEEKIRLIPDGILSYLPFDALLTENAINFSEAQYLIEKHQIKLGYSFSIVGKQEQQKKSNYPQQILAFAPFANPQSKSTKYATLSFSNDEVQQLDKLFLVELYKNDKATKAQFEKTIKNAPIVHISSHAFSSPTEEQPHIAFFDQVFYMSELYASELKADLVVLSACQTNIGKHKAGEGIMSMSRGFTYAGAKSLISSLWNTNATATGKILSSFYHQLQDKRPKPEALHQAKKAYLKDNNIPSYERSPYYWAGLIYYGDDNSLYLKTKENNGFYLKMGLFGILLISGIVYFRNKIF